MSCSSPHIALDLGVNGEGKRIIKFVPHRVDLNLKSLKAKYGSSSVLLLPCGHCVACVLKNRREWSIRCIMESLYHKYNWFITLTYNDDNLPDDNKLNRDDISSFIREVRRFRPFRFYGCGEYGSEDKTHRPHYHLIAFGLELSDLVFHSYSKTGGAQYTSKFLDDIWKKGFITVSYFSPNTAGYVAGYVDKKRLFDFVKDDSFVFMSNHPGIGYQFIRDNLDHLLKYDVVVLPGITGNLPRYVLKVAERFGYDLNNLKINRINSSHSSVIKRMNELSVYNEEEIFDYLKKINDEKYLKKVRRSL